MGACWRGKGAMARAKSNTCEHRREGSVGAVLVGLYLDGFPEFEAVGSGEGSDKGVVLCVLDGASGIDDAPAGLEAGKGVVVNLGLDF